MMTWINAAVALLAVGGLVVSALGWRHSLLRWNSAEPEAWFALAKVLYAVAIGTRIIVWDVGFGLWNRIEPDAAVTFVRGFGGADINILTSALVLCGVYASLRARQLLIPMPERERWPWYFSWMHPRWGLFR